MSIYEVHPGSWRKKSPAESFSYRELAGPLIDYVKQMGFTHVEFMPVAEHAYYPSWGYQVTGFYAPTSRYGTPEDFQFLVNALHEAGIGVIIDWVPAHFPRDDWALARFDGTALYEHEDPRKGAHQDWGTLIFNYGRHEVVNFLVANALFWCDRFHVDGLRVDAVASMLYLDYSRKEGEWIPNQYGGRENLEAIDFLKKFNHLTHTEFPGVMTIAEESTAWPLVTRPPYLGGLGFSFKWNMGWMHDTLGLFQPRPGASQISPERPDVRDDLSLQREFRPAAVARRSGAWQRFAALAACRATTGKSSRTCARCWAISGCSRGKSCCSWAANSASAPNGMPTVKLDWWLLEAGPYHRGLQRFVEDLNKLYLRSRRCGSRTTIPAGFSWIDCSDRESSVLSFLRQDSERASELVVILNLTPVPRLKYRVGLPRPGRWREVLNSDAASYGGSNQGNLGWCDLRECQVAQPGLFGPVHPAAVERGGVPAGRLTPTQAISPFDLQNSPALAPIGGVFQIKNWRPAFADRQKPNSVEKTARPVALRCQQCLVGLFASIAMMKAVGDTGLWFGSVCIVMALFEAWHIPRPRGLDLFRIFSRKKSAEMSMCAGTFPAVVCFLHTLVRNQGNCAEVPSSVPSLVGHAASIFTMIWSSMTNPLPISETTDFTMVKPFRW